MRLIVHELISSLEQRIAVKDSQIQVRAICPHIYLHNAPAGVLRVQLHQDNGELLAQSEELDLAELPITMPYYHGYIRFLISAKLQANTHYRIRLAPASGYTFSALSYAGWCTDFDLRKVPATYTPNAGLNAALDFELWDSREANRGSE